MSKGLSTPKESPKRKTEDYSKSESVAGTFDLTQWERTRWGNLYSSECPTTGGQRRRKTGPITTTTGPGKDYEAVGSGVPGEGRQLEQVRGEHLKDRPKVQFLFIHSLLTPEKPASIIFSIFKVPSEASFFSARVFLGVDGSVGRLCSYLGHSLINFKNSKT